MVDGFLRVDKPGGWTSHDVVAKCRRLLRVKKVGHSGTLDPMATGMLVLGLGRATRLLRFVQETVKEYRARALFGVATDTLDADGSILSREEMGFAETDLRKVAERFTGKIAQVPPMISAVRIGGRRLYDVARAGEEVERPARQVTVHSIEIEEATPGPYPEVAFTVTCGAGTYVRVLADDMARALGGRAHLIALRRVRVGSHRIEDAITMDDIAAAADADAVEGLVVEAGRGLEHLPEVEVAPEVGRGVRHGSVFAAASLPGAAGLFRVVEDGRLLAVYRSDGRRARPEVVLS